MVRNKYPVSRLDGIPMRPPCRQFICVASALVVRREDLSDQAISALTIPYLFLVVKYLLAVFLPCDPDKPTILVPEPGFLGSLFVHLCKPAVTLIFRPRFGTLQARQPFGDIGDPVQNLFRKRHVVPDDTVNEILVAEDFLRHRRAQLAFNGADGRIRNPVNASGIAGGSLVHHPPDLFDGRVSVPRNRFRGFRIERVLLS